MLAPLDIAVMAVYLVGVALAGLLAGGKQKGAEDYFLGGRSLPWWAVMGSIVATETSALTVIGIPALAYGGTLMFLQLTIGYLIGRIIVAFWFIPRYFRGEMTTAYAFLGERFGNATRGTASVIFLLTRLLADGVRLFATAIPVKVILASAGLEVSYVAIILVLSLLTAGYTLVGGLRSVVWMDVVQFAVYVIGALVACGLLLSRAPAGWVEQAAEAGKFQVLNLGSGLTPSELITQPYWLVCCILGGAFFGMASHGTDHLIVQRLLSCRDQVQAQKALIVSGFVVIAQFALFLGVGMLLWGFYGGQAPTDLGLARGDEIFPKYIVEEMPPGLAGLLLAAILAAAMSTLSSSLNALASSTLFDLYQLFGGGAMDETRKLKVSRVLTFIWAVVFVAFASMFQKNEGPVVEIGLSIATFTYGGLLGLFLLGLLNRRAGQSQAIAAFLLTVAVMSAAILSLRYSPEGWVLVFMPSKETTAAMGLKAIDFPWYAVLGAITCVATGSLLSWSRPRTVV